MPAPAMLHPKMLKARSAAFEKLNSYYALAESNKGRYSAVADRRIIGDGNVDQWSAKSLNQVWALCGVLREGSSQLHDAVYVVGTLSPSSVKIGLATDPIARLSQLQTGNPERLYLHRVFWTHKEGAAAGLEKRSHDFLEKKSNRLVGEWFECSPMLAHDTIIAACKSAVLGFTAVTPNDGKEIRIDRII